MRLLVSCVLLLIVALPTVAESEGDDDGVVIYKYRDEQGRLIFSDQPRDGAERVRLKEGNTAPPVQPVERRAVPAEEEAPSFEGYETFAIANPGDESTIPNGLAPTEVEVSLEPGLQAGHQVELYIDGELFERAETAQFTVPRLDRGPRTLQAAVVDEGGVELSRSRAHQVHVLWPGGRDRRGRGGEGDDSSRSMGQSLPTTETLPRRGDGGN